MFGLKYEYVFLLHGDSYAGTLDIDRVSEKFESYYECFEAAWNELDELEEKEMNDKIEILVRAVATEERHRLDDGRLWIGADEDRLKYIREVSLDVIGNMKPGEISPSEWIRKFPQDRRLQRLYRREMKDRLSNLVPEMSRYEQVLLQLNSLHRNDIMKYTLASLLPEMNRHEKLLSDLDSLRQFS
jgi:hypothetical protein